MAKNQTQQPEAPPTSTLSVADLRKRYEDLAAQSTARAKTLPGIQKEILKEASKKFQVVLDELEQLKNAKREAYIAWEQAVAEQAAAARGEPKK